MITEVTAGWARTKAVARWVSGRPASAARAVSARVASSFAWLPGTERSKLPGAWDARWLPVGSARLTDRFLTDDPPTPREIEALRSGVRDRLIQAPVLAISELVAVGGTADNLARIVAAAAEDRILTPRRLEDALAILMAEPAASAAERHAIRPERARILPAGP